MKEKKKVLLCVIGVSPEVVTQTIYGLATNELPWIPEQVIVVTTSEGRRRARDVLLRNRVFNRLLDELDIEHIDFSPTDIKAIKLRGKEIDDILSVEENIAAGDFIFDQVVELTEEGDGELRIALSGGRHTMSFFAGYAISMLGRPQDELSHVVVIDELVGDRNFFFPTEEYRERFGDRRLIHVSDLPFARISRLASLRMISEKVDFSDLCDVLEGPPYLAITSVGRAAHITLSKAIRFVCDSSHGASRLRMEPRVAALYTLYAARQQLGLGPLADEDLILNPDAYLKLYEQMLFGETGRNTVAKEDRELTVPILRSTRSRINSALRRILPEGETFRRYRVHRSKYGYYLDLSSQQVDVAAEYH